MGKSNIFLIGFMGTGKTTVSRELAKLLGYEEVDTDARIVRQQNRSIAEIFEKQGEQAFREMETGLLREFEEETHKIISCGGGMALRQENVRLMQEYGAVVLLTAEPETVFARVQDDNGRPVLNGNMNVAYIRTHGKENAVLSGGGRGSGRNRWPCSAGDCTGNKRKIII